MQELVGRLTAVDAEATETLKVIAYFDALVNGHATIDEQATAEARSDAAKRLRLDPQSRYRVIASIESEPGSSGAHGDRRPTVVVGTPYGPVRATLAVRADEAAAPGRAGIGIRATPASLPEAWASALVALRLSSAREPVVDAVDLGALLPLALSADTAAHEMPDVAALSTLISAHPDAEPLLEALTVTESLRAAGVEAGLHHSTVQARAGHYSEALGFDIRSPRGRVRLSLALHRLRTTRFE